MLKKFEVINFKNFGNNLEFDLSKTNNYEFNTECVVNGIVNKALIYGYNGVGKSNLGFAIFDLISHTTDKEKNKNFYNNYLYADSTIEMAIFKYTFIVGDGEVYYEYGKSNLETIIYERLIINKSDFASVDRRKSSIMEINAIGAETLKRDLGESQISIIRYIKNNSLLEENPDNHCFKEFLNFIDGMLFFRSLDKNNYIGLEQGSNNIQKEIISKGLIEDFEKFLNDAGIECKLTTVTGEDEPYIALAFNNGKINFFECASQGTISLTLFYYWYQRLKGADSNVTFLFIDEFDAFYHHHLSIMIIKLLRDIKSQVIITTHNTSVMTNELLRPDCYFFIDKNGIHSLSSSTPKELREAHNIEKMYRAGAFGG